MVEIKDKLKKIEYYIDNGEYFTINKPRQYGKTTTINQINKYLNNKYFILEISFEGLGDYAFESEERFCKSFISLLNNRIEKNNFQNEFKLWFEDLQNVNNFELLSKKIVILNECILKKTILIIDEVDKSSNNQLFLNFLSMIRNLFLEREKGYLKTFHSVILAGVHDVKNLKLKIRPSEEQKYNSPWNIASDFEVDMSFNPNEISTMLIEYKNEIGIEFDVKDISEIIYEFTNGYPFLISKICKLVDEKLNKDWSKNGINNALKLLIKENNTLFESIIKNIENNNDLKQFIYDILIDGIEYSFAYTDSVISTGLIYGIFRESNGKVLIDNKIFEILIYNHFSVLKERSEKRIKKVSSSNFILSNGDLDIVRVIEKFQDLMKMEYRYEDEAFIEREGRLLFLAFIKPIINGSGFYFVEPQLRNNTRMDVVITFNKKRYVVELKIWRGVQYENYGIEQLVNYIDTIGEDFGYLITFSFNKNKKYKKEWIKKDNKNIFSVIV
jgi:hypothetical protein